MCLRHLDASGYARELPVYAKPEPGTRIKDAPLASGSRYKIDWQGKTYRLEPAEGRNPFHYYEMVNED